MFQKVNHLLGHFCRATGYDPTGRVTDNLEELAEMMDTGASNWEIHRMIDVFAGNMAADPGAEFQSFSEKFWMNSQDKDGSLRTLIELTHHFTPQQTINPRS